MIRYGSSLCLQHVSFVILQLRLGIYPKGRIPIRRSPKESDSGGDLHPSERLPNAEVYEVLFDD